MYYYCQSSCLLYLWHTLVKQYDSLVRMKFITITSACVRVCVCVCIRLCTILGRCTYLHRDIEQVRVTKTRPWRNLGLEVETEITWWKYQVVFVMGDGKRKCFFGNRETWCVRAWGRLAGAGWGCVCRGLTEQMMLEPIRAHILGDKVEKGYSDQKKERVVRHSF